MPAGAQTDRPVLPGYEVKTQGDVNVPIRPTRFARDDVVQGHGRGAASPPFWPNITNQASIWAAIHRTCAVAWIKPLLRAHIMPSRLITTLIHLKHHAHKVDIMTSMQTCQRLTRFTNWNSLSHNLSNLLYWWPLIIAREVYSKICFFFTAFSLPS